MHDQANDLRQLVRQCSPEDTPAHRRRPRLIAVTGKGGVGATTVAVNLAVAIRRQRQRTLLIDVDPHGGNAALLCGLRERYTVADVLSGRRTVSEAIQLGTGAIRVLPGVWGLERLADHPPTAAERMLNQLLAADTEADVLVLDAGNGADQIATRLCRAADLILVVTTSESPSILDGYASIKTFVESDPSGPICTLVNRTSDAEVAQDVHRRLVQAAHRFLGISLQDAGHVPVDDKVTAAAAAGEPFVVTAPDCPAARQIDRLARTLPHLMDVEKTHDTETQGRQDKEERMTA